MERKYYIKMDWIFNLESMHDKLYCIMYDLEDHKLSFPLVLTGKKINNFDDLDDLINECSDLESIAKSRKVTSKEYGRIKQIVEWRVMVRYSVCLNNGMDERKASTCFNDL